MSVLKTYQNLSDMEFWKNGFDIRKEVTIWLLKDFGNSRKPIKLQNVIKDMSEDDKKLLQDLIDKYDRKPLKNLYPEWFADSERIYLLELCRDMMAYIVQANSIYPVIIAEADQRRNLQDRAIGCCFNLYQELDYITRLFPSDLNMLTRLLDKTEREIELLKGWRQSDYSGAKKKFNIQG